MGWRARRGTSARSGEGLSTETNHRDQGPDQSFANAKHAGADAVWCLRVPNGTPEGVQRTVRHAEADRHADRKRGVAVPSLRRLFGVLGHEPSGEWRWGGCFGSGRNDQLASASGTARRVPTGGLRSGVWLREHWAGPDPLLRRRGEVERLPPSGTDHDQRSRTGRMLRLRSDVGSFVVLRNAMEYGPRLRATVGFHDGFEGGMRSPPAKRR